MNEDEELINQFFKKFGKSKIYMRFESPEDYETFKKIMKAITSVYPIKSIVLRRMFANSHSKFDKEQDVNVVVKKFFDIYTYKIGKPVVTFWRDFEGVIVCEVIYSSITDLTVKLHTPEEIYNFFS